MKTLTALLASALCECGTVCCIAGWTLLLRGYSTRPLEDDDCNTLLMFADPSGKEVEWVDDPAREELGINLWQARRLFDLDAWPKRLRSRYRSGDKTAAVDMLNLIAQENQKERTMT